MATLLERRETARVAALATFVVAFVLGAWLVLTLESDPDPRPLSSTSTSTSTTTTTLEPAPGQPVVVLVPAPPGATDRANEATEVRGFADRVFTPGVVALAQLGVALLAALLAAAAVQRALLGRYAFKVGTFEVGEVGEEDVEGLKEAMDDIDKKATALVAALVKRVRVLEKRLEED